MRVAASLAADAARAALRRSVRTKSATSMIFTTQIMKMITQGSLLVMLKRLFTSKIEFAGFKSNQFSYEIGEEELAVMRRVAAPLAADAARAALRRSVRTKSAASKNARMSSTTCLFVWRSTL